jgi:hypothetical protein
LLAGGSLTTLPNVRFGATGLYDGPIRLRTEWVRVSFQVPTEAAISSARNLALLDTHEKKEGFLGTQRASVHRERNVDILRFCITS